MISFFINAIKIIFLLGLLVFIHEGGHFLVAKLCNVKVNEFALGFGPTIWKKQGKETKYAIRLIPLGGFVSMEGEETKSEHARSFSKASILKRILIVAAGATVNIIFGFIIYFCLISYSGPSTSCEIDSVVPDFGAESAGLRSNDKIIKIDNKRVIDKQEINEALQSSQGKEVKVTVERDNKKIEYNIKPTEVGYKETGIYLKSDESTQIVAIDENSPAKEGGLEVNDVILYIENQDVKNNPQKVIDIINSDEDGKVDVIVERNGVENVIQISANEKSAYYLGVNMKPAEKSFLNNIYYGFNKTIKFATSIVENVKELITGKVSKDQLMGPVGISSVVSNTEGFKEYIYILAVISLSLGVTNLLPFPPLDGGKIVLLLIEAVRRKSLSEEIEGYIQITGFVLLITLSIYITYNDILRIF